MKKIIIQKRLYKIIQIQDNAEKPSIKEINKYQIKYQLKNRLKN